MTQTQATVRRHVVVDSAIDRAFSVFTERFGDFKPPEHNLLSAPLAETIFEPRVGGHIFDRTRRIGEALAIQWADVGRTVEVRGPSCGCAPAGSLPLPN
jgi:hypothetical protein